MLIKWKLINGRTKVKVVQITTLLCIHKSSKNQQDSIFLIELTKYLGFYPDIPDRLPSEAVFDLQEGMVKSAVTGPLLLSTEKSAYRFLFLE